MRRSVIPLAIAGILIAGASAVLAESKSTTQAENKCIAKASKCNKGCANPFGKNAGAKAQACEEQCGRQMNSCLDKIQEVVANPTNNPPKRPVSPGLLEGGNSGSGLQGPAATGSPIGGNAPAGRAN